MKILKNAHEFTWWFIQNFIKHINGIDMKHSDGSIYEFSEGVYGVEWIGDVDIHIKVIKLFIISHHGKANTITIKVDNETVAELPLTLSSKELYKYTFPIFKNCIGELVDVQDWRVDLLRVNCYTCESCGKHTTTVDVDEGVTPAFIECIHCNGMSRSNMYPKDRPIPDHLPEPTHEWYMPDINNLTIEEEVCRDHIEQGGLLMRKRTDAMIIPHDIEVQKDTL